MKPKTYLDKEIRENSNYFFISYSHKDIDIVYPILQKLYDKGINYWYDVELDPGDRWNEEVEEIINNYDCKYGIVFLSENSMVSEAVENEIKLMQKKNEKLMKEEEKKFKYIPIYLDSKNKDDFLNKVSQKYGYSSKKFRFLLDALDTDLNAELGTAIEKIEDVARKNQLTEKINLSIKDSFLSFIDSKLQNGERSFQCGSYYFDEMSKEKAIDWILVRTDENLYYFVSKYCLDFVTINDIEKTILRIKESINEIQCVTDISLLNEDFLLKNKSAINMSIPTDYADKNRQQLLRLFWIYNSLENKYELYNCNNIKIEEKIQKNKINAGIRLMMTIDNKKIKKN